jgi:N-acetylglucosamine-6-sulfatase
VLFRSTNDRPFFAFLSFWQPHAPAEYPPFWDDTYANAQLPTGGSFNEADVSDKPAWVQRRDLIGAEEKAALTEHYRNRLRGTRYVDAKIGSIIDLIKSHREYANTYVVFYSDNGFHIGQHRLRTDKFGGPKGTKGTPYIEDVRFPLVVKGPGVRVGAESEAMAQNIDIRPTVEDMVGAATPAGVDGITLLPHLKTGAAFPREYALTEALKPLGSASTWKAVYGPDTAYVEYDGGEREFYDLRKDPHQLENDPLDPRAAEHAEALQRMAGCEGKGCQEAAEGP